MTERQVWILRYAVFGNQKEPHRNIYFPFLPEERDLVEIKPLIEMGLMICCPVEGYGIFRDVTEVYRVTELGQKLIGAIEIPDLQRRLELPPNFNLEES